ncbi:hypothetical protein EYF80_018129 [Liparis tanakae]|uniref:Secreted protein n=1 Tax=Liparis tanakae TaxID=230148 RepID=A0A4Z2I2R2_9TELE|nr:hypothetical protein EYF80_018129 [Liparis tanakae]
MGRKEAALELLFTAFIFMRPSLHAGCREDSGAYVGVFNSPPVDKAVMLYEPTRWTTMSCYLLVWSLPLGRVGPHWVELQ